MSKFVLMLFIALDVGIQGSAQKYPKIDAEHRVILLKNDTLYQFYAVFPPSRKWKTDPQRNYYWYAYDTILTTRGSFSNRLLNGHFQVFFPAHNLYEEGSFKYGLKNGLWQTWYPNGHLHFSCHWQNGYLHGYFMEFDEKGDKLKEGNYQYNQLSGAVTTYLPGGKTVIRSYKDGKLVADVSIQKNQTDSTGLAPKIK